MKVGIDVLSKGGGPFPFQFEFQEHSGGGISEVVQTQCVTNVVFLNCFG